MGKSVNILWAASLAIGLAWPVLAESTTSARDNAKALALCVLDKGDLESYKTIYLGKSIKMPLHQDLWSEHQSEIHVNSDESLTIRDICTSEARVDLTPWRECIGFDRDSDGQIDSLTVTQVPQVMVTIWEDGRVEDTTTLMTEKKYEWVELDPRVQESYEEILKEARSQCESR